MAFQVCRLEQVQKPKNTANRRATVVGGKIVKNTFSVKIMTTNVIWNKKKCVNRLSLIFLCGQNNETWVKFSNAN